MTVVNKFRSILKMTYFLLLLAVLDNILCYMCIVVVFRRSNEQPMATCIIMCTTLADECQGML